MKSQTVKRTTRFVSILMTITLGFISSIIPIRLMDSAVADETLEDSRRVFAYSLSAVLPYPFVVLDTNNLPKQRQEAIHALIDDDILSICNLTKANALSTSVYSCPTNNVTRGEIAELLMNRTFRDGGCDAHVDVIVDETTSFGHQFISGESCLYTPTFSHFNIKPFGFTDISHLSEYRQKAINWLANIGVTLGCNKAKTQFCPDKPLTRGSLAELMFKWDSGSGTKYFQDYTPNFKDIKNQPKSRIQAINWMMYSYYSKGCNKSGTKYCPNNIVNRGSISEIFNRSVLRNSLYLRSENNPQITIETTKCSETWYYEQEGMSSKKKEVKKGCK